MDDYSLEMFGRMIADRPRHNAYVSAIRSAVRPGHLVLDIGTGVGVYALLAAKLGARKVYALDVNPLIRFGPELAERNGLADRVEFIEALSTDVTLDHRADVIIADLRGVLPYHGGHLPSLRDAVERHLAADGELLPNGDRVFASVSANPRGRAASTGVWLENGLGLDLSPLAVSATNLVRADRVEQEAMLTEPVEVASLSYRSEPDPDLEFEGSLRTVVGGEADGISMWFDATIAEGVAYSTGPNAPETVYGMAFLPFEEPVRLYEGDRVDLRLSARLFGDDYVWSWSASTSRPGESREGGGWETRRRTIDAAPLDAAAIARRRVSHRPAPLAPEAAADLVALRLLIDGASIGEAADALVEAVPDLTADRVSGLRRVGDLVDRYHR